MRVEDTVHGQIEQGVVVLLGIHHQDTTSIALALAKQVAHIRLIEHSMGMQSLASLNLEALVISQFTLYAENKKGRRLSFTQAASREQAEVLYNTFVQALSDILSVPVACGVFGAHMLVQLENDGPYTVLLDSALGSQTPTHAYA